MVFPSPFEEHIGQVWDPRPNQNQIAEAKNTLHQFLSDMDASRVPIATLTQVNAAVEVLGKFAGYPSEAHHMEMFLESKEAASYRTTATVLKGFAEEMEVLILARVEAAQMAERLGTTSGRPAEHSGKHPISEDELPF
jgi:hypothetical protein